MSTPHNGDERPSTAGVYDAALGGTENTAADRTLVERTRVVMPHIIEGAWANRGFLQRAVTRMAGEWGIRQFIDVGSGMPTQRNTHQVAAEACPDARVLYVDNDPRVIARADRLLVDMDHTAAILGDLRDPETILNHPLTRRLIDFTQPVGLLVVAVVHFVPDTDDPWSAVARLMVDLPSGSYLALSSVTSDRQEETWDAIKQQVNPMGYDGHPRTRAQLERFFTGLEIVPPYDGARAELANIGLWGAEDPDLADDDGSHLSYAAVARKP